MDHKGDMASVPDRAHQSLMEGIAGESSSTAALILEAAITILARDGYQSLTARHVAEEAGTNLALINYYFGGKQGLLLAVYDVLERQRYARQTQMYGDPDEPLSVKWRRATEFYRQDLADGFVRIHHELMIQGLANPQLAERARQRIRVWNDLLTEVAEQYLPVLGVNVSPSLLAPAFTAFWYGMEQQHLIGMREEETPYFEILQRIGDWLEAQERDAQRQTVTG
jgi:AcrR family transcriptional regulator